MLVRRPFNVVAVAVAHKLARIAWSIVARGEKFDPVRAFGPGTRRHETEPNQPTRKEVAWRGPFVSWR